MFTAGLELLMCAAELSGPTRPSSGRCLVGGVLSPAWLLLFVERFSCWGGRRTGYSCFTPGLVCPRRSPSHPLPAFSPAKKTIRVMKPREMRSHAGQPAWAAAPSPPIPPETCFLECPFPVICEGAGIILCHLSSLFKSRSQTAGRAQHPSLQLPPFPFPGGGRTGTRQMKF